MNGADDAREQAHDPDAGEGHPECVGPREAPATSAARSWGAAPPPAPALLPGRGTKLLSIQSSPVTNVMLVNKPPAGHQGTTQAHTHCGGQARAHPEPGRAIRSPKCVRVCWGEGGYKRAAKFIALSCSPRMGWRRDDMGPKWGAIAPSPAPSPHEQSGSRIAAGPAPRSVPSREPLSRGSSETN